MKILIIFIIVLLVPIAVMGQAVAYNYDDEVIIDIDSYYSTLIMIPFDAPQNGYVEFSYSFYAQTECSNLDLLLSEVRKEGDVPDDSKGPSYVMDYYPASPMTWRQVMPVSEGMNYYGLFIRDGSIRKDGNDDQSKEKYSVTFSNVNISATFIHNYYGPVGD